MPLEVVPLVSSAQQAALERVLVRVGIELGAKPERSLTGWAQAAALEAVDARSPMVGYTRSPRSTPGATRA